MDVRASRHVEYAFWLRQGRQTETDRQTVYSFVTWARVALVCRRAACILPRARLMFGHRRRAFGRPVHLIPPPDPSQTSLVARGEAQQLGEPLRPKHARRGRDAIDGAVAAPRGGAVRRE